MKLPNKTKDLICFVGKRLYGINKCRESVHVGAVESILIYKSGICFTIGGELDAIEETYETEGEANMALDAHLAYIGSLIIKGGKEL